MQVIYRYRFYILLTLFAANLLIFWPGIMLGDSLAQYAQAVSGQYSDHHPPLMSLVWHYLGLLHNGPGLMLVLQLGLLYGSIALLLRTVDFLPELDTKRWSILFLLLLPILPQVLIYDMTILKDVQYAVSFLLAASILAYYTVLNKPPSVSVAYVLVSLLIYGAGVKFQGQYCLIVLTIWFGCILFSNRKLWFKLLSGLILYALIFSSIIGINNELVPQSRKNNSWQLVKLYDLAAISIASNEDLIPEFNKTSSYTYYKLITRFKYPSVDNYIFTDDKILKIVETPVNSKALLEQWKRSVLQHPLVYLKHRTINLSYTLFSRPGYQFAQAIVAKIPTDSIWHSIADRTAGVLFYLFMSHLPVIILGVFYFVWSLLTWHYSRAAPVLLGFSSLALSMVVVLFFMSMAGTPRYTYISIILIHASHIFAYACYRRRNEVLQ